LRVEGELMASGVWPFLQEGMGASFALFMVRETDARTAAARNFKRLYSLFIYF